MSKHENNFYILVILQIFNEIYETTNEIFLIIIFKQYDIYVLSERQKENTAGSHLAANDVTDAANAVGGAKDIFDAGEHVGRVDAVSPRGWNKQKY